MTSTAPNLPLYPDKAARPSKRRTPGTFGNIDNTVLAYQKIHGAADTRVLTALAERNNFTYKPSLMSVAELQVETGLCERAVQKALKVLAAAGFCHQEGRCWTYGKAPANSRANGKANGEANEKANSRTVFFGGIAVQYGENPSLKMLEDVRRFKTNITCTDWPAQFPVVAGGNAVQKTSAVTDEQLAPGGAASDEASTDLPSHFQEKNVTDMPKNEKHDTGSETVPAAPADPVPAAYAVLDGAGLLDVWGKWFNANPALSRNRVALEAQICQFATWVADGLVEQLRENVLDIVSAGSFAHPFNTLKPRMEKAKAVRDAQIQNAADVRRIFGEARCQPGERRRDPATGKVWTVEEVTRFGGVIFEEGAAPTEAQDAAVAGWEVMA